MHVGMKIGFRMKTPSAIEHAIRDLQPHPVAGFARPVSNERDYREAKELLGRTMRAARSHASAIRAEALLREIVDYEMRIDGDHLRSEWALTPLSFDDDYDGPKRRWSDPVNYLKKD